MNIVTTKIMIAQILKKPEKPRRNRIVITYYHNKHTQIFKYIQVYAGKINVLVLNKELCLIKSKRNKSVLI